MYVCMYAHSLQVMGGGNIERIFPGIRLISFRKTAAGGAAVEGAAGQPKQKQQTRAAPPAVALQVGR